MKVWLTRKYAERIDGVSLKGFVVGDTLDLALADARLLLAEQWAKPERRKRARRPVSRRRQSDRS